MRRGNRKPRKSTNTGTARQAPIPPRQLRLWEART